MLRSVLLLSVVVVAAGCATMSDAPAGMEAGKFVSYTCEKGGFQARWNPDSKSVRVRSQHGAAELSAGADGTYSGDNFLMRTSGPDGVSLAHDGKVLGSKCKKA